jgi:hypothetical protein
MRRILLSCATLAVLVLPTAASAGARASSTPGFLVVRNAAGDGGVNGEPVITLAIVGGFVLGRVTQEARVDIYQLPSATCGGCAPQAVGPDVSSKPVRWRKKFSGREFNGSGFRFRASATGGAYRVVVRGSGVYLFAGGQGTVRLRGSSYNRNSDGKYSIDGNGFLSLPAQELSLKVGGG